MELQSKLIYPNPFEPSGIEFTLSVGGSVTLEILDEQGKAIAPLVVQKPYGAGTHRVQFDTREAAGARFYRLSIEIQGKIMHDVKAIQIRETEDRDHQG
jgi:hypothetical protein